MVDRAAAEEWVRRHAQLVGQIEVAHARAWATALRVPLADGVAWLKVCGPNAGKQVTRRITLRKECPTCGWRRFPSGMTS